MAVALRALAAAEPEHGVPADRLVALAANVAGWDVGFCMRAIEVLAAMPLTWQAFDEGRISWSQLRGIISAAKALPVADRETLDDQLTGLVDSNNRAEPERLPDVAADLARRLADARQAEREQAQAEQSFIRFQPSLLGGADFYGRGDDDQIATLTAALDAAADPPVADDDDLPTDTQGRPVPAAWRRHTARATQRMEALRRIAAHSLAGRAQGTARPSITAVVDITDLTPHRSASVGGAPSHRGSSEFGAAPRSHDAESRSDQSDVLSRVPNAAPAATARMLWNLAGGRRPLSTAAVRMLACDASHTPLLTDGTRLLAIGDAYHPISSGLRRAVTTRDQGCRFPACRAPAAHTDLHHVIHRAEGGPTEAANLVALCRPHHRLVHQHGWTLTLAPDGRLDLKRGRWHLTSQPRLRPPPPSRAASHSGDPPNGYRQAARHRRDGPAHQTGADPPGQSVPLPF